MYAWIKVKLQGSSLLTHAYQINNKYAMNAHKHICKYMEINMPINQIQVMGLWANNLPLFDDDKTHGLIYAWIKVKLQGSSPLTHAYQINNKYAMNAHKHVCKCMEINMPINQILFLLFAKQNIYA